MSGEDDDASDWLSGQFEETTQVPAQPVAPPPAQPVAPPPAKPVAPPPAATTPPAQPIAPVPSAPVPNSKGGFDWGLKPGGSVVEPPPVEAAVQPPVVTSPPPLTPPPVTAPPATAPPVIAPPVSQPPTEPYVSEPTKPLSWDEFASTQQPPAQQPVAAQPFALQQSAPDASPVEEATQAYTVQPWLPAASSLPVGVPAGAPEVSPGFGPAAEPDLPHDPADPTSAIDSLFGDHKFQDYEEVGVLQTIQAPPASPVVEPKVVEPREPLSGTQKVLMGVAAGLIAALILVGLFFLGQHLGTAAAATPAPKTTGSASSATPTPAGTGGPAAPGVRQWTALQGGECIQPFSSAWAVSFTVVACTADHDAEMVFKGTLPDGSETKYPSASGFQKEITPLCSAPTAINYGAAVSVTDLQVSFSYPPNAAAWIKGDRTYYCFVDRVSGGNLPGDLSVPKTK